MRSKHFLTASIVVFGFASLAGAATGCGGDKDTGTGGSGGAASSSDTGTTTKPSTSTTTGTMNGSPASVTTGSGNGNHDFSTAAAFEINSRPATEGTLVDVVKTKDYYKFEGKAGERIIILVGAQDLAMASGFDPSIVDTVVTVYDANKTQIARNNDAFPTQGTDSTLFTTLPTDGTYYVTLEGCASAFPGGGCGKASDVKTLDYDLSILDTNQLAAEVFEKAEPNNDAATAKPVPYKKTSASSYGLYIVDGTFKDATDVDAFSLKVPADVPTAKNQRPHMEFFLQPIGTENGTGAAANAKLQLFDAADPSKPIAEINQTNHGPGGANGPADLSVPVIAGHTYTLLVSNASAASTPAKDFYFMEHVVGTYWLEEAEASPDTNDDIMTPEALKVLNSEYPGAYFIDGDLSSDKDVDYYSMDIPSTAKIIAMDCAAQRMGSGLRSPKWTLLKADGTKISADSELTESATEDGTIGYTSAIDLPAGTTKVLLKAESTASRDPNVTGTYYLCRILTE